MWVHSLVTKLIRKLDLVFDFVQLLNANSQLWP